MIYVTVVGDEKYYRDAAMTSRLVGSYLMETLNDITGTIGGLARAAAPGRTKEAVGETRAHPTGGNLFEGKVGLTHEPKYAKFVHEGTGIYGPLRRPYTITKRQTHFPPNWGRDRTGRLNPAVGNVFKIATGDGSHYYRKTVTVQGQKSQPFLTEAFELAKHTEVPLRIKILGRKLVH